MQLFVKAYDILRQLRWYQWYKGLFVFFALLWVQHSSVTAFSLLLAGAVAFSFASSIVYIINDFSDIDRDRKHPIKKLRPLAAGKINPLEAFSLILLLTGVVMVLVGLLNNTAFTAVILVYLLLNLVYTYYIKHVAYFDIAFVALFAGMRVVAGFVLLGLPVAWTFVSAVVALYLFILTVQRLAEVTVNNIPARPVISKYSAKTLKFMMTFFMMLAVILYFVAISLVALPLVYTDALYFMVLLVVHEYMCFSENRKDIAESGLTFFIYNRIGLVLLVLFVLTIVTLGVLFL